jgi:hypothetical protein
MGNSLKRSGSSLTSSSESLEVPGILPKDIILYIIETILEDDVVTVANLRRTCKFYYHLVDSVEWFAHKREIYPLVGEYHCAVIVTAKFQNVAYFARYCNFTLGHLMCAAGITSYSILTKTLLSPCMDLWKNIGLVILNGLEVEKFG